MAMRTTMEQCEDTVRRYLRDCQEAGNAPSETHYRKWRGKRPKPDLGHEKIGNSWAPTLDAIKLHGPDTFTRLLEKLGVEVPPKPAAPRPYSEAECIQALTGFLRHCWNERQRSTESYYLVWHEARKQETPSSHQIMAKFGRWTKARNRAVQAIGQPPAP